MTKNCINITNIKISNPVIVTYNKEKKKKKF